MFTGIIQHVGTVRAVQPAQSGSRVTIDLGNLAEGLDRGDSVAVNGACLTAVTIDSEQVSFDVVSETLSRTTLGKLSAGSKVNLERALGASDRLDGHIVQGHVDGTAQLRRIDRGGQCVFTFSADTELAAQMVPKGSVALDGISLTLAEVSAGTFSVAIIPTTLAETTMGDMRTGSRVNVELDVIGKYVRAYMASCGLGGSGGLTIEKLKGAGFM